MKIIIFFICIILFASLSYAQGPTSTQIIPTYRITIGGGISPINPKEINDHISTSNTLLESTTPTIKSAPELGLAFTFHPMKGNQIIIVRGSYIWIKRTYDFTVAETDNSPQVKGYSNGTIKETYSAYPFSLGVGLASANPFAQLTFEFIYALGYITEEGSFISSVGRKTVYTRTLYSPAYGFRVAAQTTIQMTNNIGLTLEAGYRGLKFDEYEDEVSTQPAGITFSLSGIFGFIGISVAL